MVWVAWPKLHSWLPSTTINRWVVKYSPQLEEAFHRRKRPVWISWRMDETYIKVKGEWRYRLSGNVS
jgi:transposase-like protein